MESEKRFSKKPEIANLLTKDGKLKTIKPNEWEVILLAEGRSMTEILNKSPYKKEMFFPYSPICYGFYVDKLPLERAKLGVWRSLVKDFGYSKEKADAVVGIKKETRSFPIPLAKSA